MQTSKLTEIFTASHLRSRSNSNLGFYSFEMPIIKHWTIHFLSSSFKALRMSGLTDEKAFKQSADAISG